VAKPLEPAGFWLFGLVCVILAVLKLAAGAQWSWWRVSLPLCAVLGHNIVYIIVGFVWLSFADDGAAEEAITIRPGDGGYGYQIAALVCFVVSADNVLRRIEGPGENMLWVGSGRWELIVVSGMLSVLMQLLFWSKVVDPGTRRTHRGTIGTPSIVARVLQYSTSFLTVRETPLGRSSFLRMRFSVRSNHFQKWLLLRHKAAFPWAWKVCASSQGSRPFCAASREQVAATDP
jgi:hypothetical protein